MIRIIIGIIIGIVIGLINAAAGTAYGLSKSNIVGAAMGKAKDFAADADKVEFYDMREERPRRR